MFSREYLQQSATETGFRSATLERVLRLERLLGQVRRHPFLRDRLALKGGTALNLFFGGPVPRLSVDLDFNYVRPVERAEMLREKPEVERAVATIVEGDRYRLQWGREEHAGRTLYLGYRNGLGTDDHIEVDVNFLHRVPLVPPAERDGWTPDPDLPLPRAGRRDRGDAGRQGSRSARPWCPAGSLRRGFGGGWAMDIRYVALPAALRGAEWRTGSPGDDVFDPPPANPQPGRTGRTADARAASGRAPRTRAPH